METTPAVATKWAVDPTHSEVQFKVKHLVISTVTGTFKAFEGEVRTGSDDFDGAEVDFRIDVNSIDTNVSDRDAHLRSDDFFASDKFPHITFNGRLKKAGENSYTLSGELTMRGVTRVLTLEAELGGTVVDPYGNTKAGFEVNGKVNRKEFGLNWSAVTEAGSIVVGDEVKLHFNVQLARA